MVQFYVTVPEADTWRFSMDAAFEKALLSVLAPWAERQVKILNTIPVANTPSINRTLIVRFDVPTIFDGLQVNTAINSGGVDYVGACASRGLVLASVQDPTPVPAKNGGVGGYPWLHTMRDAQAGLYASSEQTTDTSAPAGRRLLRRLGFFA